MKPTLLSLSIAVGAVACSSANGSQGGGTADAPPGHFDGSNTGSGSDGSTSNAKPIIFTIVLENHDYAEIVGSANAPYINNTLIAQGGLATNYKDTNHPSLPNYLHMISGADQYPGYIDLDPTFFPFPVDQPNLGTQLEAANIPWRSYQESMGTACSLSGAGEWAPKHDPFLYFTDQQNGANNLCANTNVDYSQFAADLASNNYRYMWITPNLLDDGHDPSTDPVTGLKQTDMWLSTEVPKILNSDGYKAGGILFITWDEAEGRNGDDPDKIPMIILSPKLKTPGMQLTTAWTHSSYLATVEDRLGLPRLATVTNEPNMMDFMNP
jgi:phosphatidylinositol-3-phosphatase